MADTIDPSDEIPENQKIELIKAIERIEAILDRLEQCPAIDARAKDILEIALSLMVQQVTENIAWKPLDINSLTELEDVDDEDEDIDEDTDAPSAKELNDWLKESWPNGENDD